MKKHLVILCGIYYPEPSATGLCARKFSEILSDEYDIDILCISDSGEAQVIKSGNGITVYTMSSELYAMEKRHEGFVGRILHFVSSIKIKLKILGSLDWVVKAYYNKLCEINDNRKIDAVLSVCSPFAAHCAAAEFKKSHKDVKTVFYTVDPYSAKNRVRPLFVSRKRLARYEKKILSLCDRLLVSEEVSNHRADLCSGNKSTAALPYIMDEFMAPDGERKYFNSEDINCVYAGSFYEDIRNPSALLEQFSKIKDKRIKLYLFSRGCEEIVKAYSEKHDNIIANGCVPHEEMPYIYRDADILIDVSNNLSEFLPSKTFEYIAVRKPIVSFYDEVKNSELERYPISFLTDGKKHASAEIEDFILMSYRKRPDLDEINNIFCKNTVDNAKKVLTEALN